MPRTALVVVAATRNPGKLKEINAILSRRARGVKVKSLADYPEAPKVAETAATLEGNAELKARATANATGRPALADDSGLFVRALGGKPGVKSARFAGARATDADNRRKLVGALLKSRDTRRGAEFRCVAALALPDGRIFLSEGSVKGRIVLEERGLHGFGYDSLFVPCGYAKTFAELGPKVKDAISHRRRALEKMVGVLARLTRQ